MHVKSPALLSTWRKHSPQNQVQGALPLSSSSVAFTVPFFSSTIVSLLKLLVSPEFGPVSESFRLREVTTWLPEGDLADEPSLPSGVGVATGTPVAAEEERGKAREDSGVKLVRRRSH